MTFRLELLAELEEAGDDLALLGDAVVLDLDEIIFLPEDLDEAAAGLAGGLVVVVEQVLRDEGGEAAGEADEALRVLGEGLEIRARLVVEALEMGVGDQLKEVLVAGEVAAEQAEVVDGSCPRRSGRCGRGAKRRRGRVRNRPAA
jgi:hypothetical protein